MPKDIQNMNKETKDAAALQRIEKPIEEYTIHLVAGGIPIICESQEVLVLKRIPEKKLYPEYGNFNTFHINDQLADDGKGGKKVVFESAIGAQMREMGEEFINSVTEGRVAPIITKAFDFVDPEIQVRFVFAGVFALELSEAQANTVMQLANGEVPDQKLPEHNAGWRVSLAELPEWISCMTPAEQFVLAKIKHDRPEPNVVSNPLYRELVKPIRDALRKEKLN